MQRNPSPPLLYRRKERYSSGNAKSQFAVSASIAASVAGGCLVHPAVESLRISRSVAIGIFSHNDTVQQRGRPAGRNTSESRHAGPVCCNGWFAGAYTQSKYLIHQFRMPVTPGFFPVY